MPFTFTHPAIVLPLKKLFPKWFSMSGLIVGSVTPDFEYFIRMTPYSEYSHTILGLFTFNLPIGILLTFIFHLIVKEDLIENLPTQWQQRISFLKELDWLDYFKKHWGVICLSIMIGAFSHIFWDAFTHRDVYFVHLLDLKRTVTAYEIPIYKILQHGSTLVGGSFILFYLYRMPQINVVTSPPSWIYWLTLATVTAIVLLIRFFLGLSIYQYGNVIVTGLSGGMIGMICFPFLKKINF